jgi:hypothetical protein
MMVDISVNGKRQSLECDSRSRVNIRNKDDCKILNLHVPIFYTSVLFRSYMRQII